MNVLLISTYELGRQPFGLASPAAWLRRAGAQVTCIDLSREEFREEPFRDADLLAFYVPMHTATRLAIEMLPAVRQLNPRAHLCFYGLYAPVNESHLRKLGVQTILGGEFEEGLTHLLNRLRNTNGGSGSAPSEQEQSEPVVSLARQQFITPDRSGLPHLKNYARLLMPDGTRRIVGYTEATRGCKHLCRHCPIVPVYNGAFRVVDRDVVLSDIRAQVAAGAQHITFGDPDFFNGPSHAMAIVRALHNEFPQVSYDVTIKIEHLLQHSTYLRELRDTGCAFVISAVESVDDSILLRLDKGHTRADFLAALAQCRAVGLPLQPTFVAFTPWTTLDGYCDLLGVIAKNSLIENVTPIQLAIRLLIPSGSRLLELSEVREIVASFDEAALAYPWRNPDPRVDRLAEEIHEIVGRAEKLGRSRAKSFKQIWQAAHRAAALDEVMPPQPVLVARAAVPYLTEPWYC
ncbi:MAG: radical SAM protein [Acidipila sp.]|nr:radical SAM protein [Acidipila sp.]